MDYKSISIGFISGIATAILAYASLKAIKTKSSPVKTKEISFQSKEYQELKR